MSEKSQIALAVLELATAVVLAWKEIELAKIAADRDIALNGISQEE